MANKSERITFDEANQLFSYNPETGFLINKRNRGRARAGCVVGGVGSYGYIVFGFGGKIYSVHRVAWLLSYGEWPKECIDHINGDPTDNRLSNLRAVSKADNNKNSKMRKGNTSGVTGVYWNAEKKFWGARINKEPIELGEYSDWFEAVCARKSAEHKYGYHPNHGLTANQRAHFIPHNQD